MIGISPGPTFEGKRKEGKMCQDCDFDDDGDDDDYTLLLVSPEEFSRQGIHIVSAYGARVPEKEVFSDPECCWESLV